MFRGDGADGVGKDQLTTGQVFTGKQIKGTEAESIAMVLNIKQSVQWLGEAKQIYSVCFPIRWKTQTGKSNLGEYL